MLTQLSLLAELEEAIHSGSQDKRVTTLRRVTDLFLSESDCLNESQVAVFDDVLCHLVKRVEIKAIAELSSRLAPVDNAPIELIRRLAKDDNIAVAQPVLSQSARLTGDDLVEIAKSKGQQHLLAIAERRTLSSIVTDILVIRGDRDVRHAVAKNPSATLSESSFAALVENAESDDELAERVGLRIDLPSRLLQELLQKATETVRARLFATASVEQQENIRRALLKVSGDIQREFAKPRDFKHAIARIEVLKERDLLNSEQIESFARTRQHEEVVAALASLTAMPVELVAPVMRSTRSDGLMVVCKAAGLPWRTGKAILQGRIIKESMSEAELMGAEQEYSQLSESAAQRTLRFWKVRMAL